MIEIPEWLKKELKNQYDEKELEYIQKGYQEKRKTIFRVNTLKSYSKEVIVELIKNEIKYNQLNNSIVPDIKLPEIFCVEDDLKLRQTNIYNEGKIYIQNLSSMIPPLFINPKENEDILDMAAAPGAKTTEIAALSMNKSNITACERNTIRLDKMIYNIKKQGAKVYCINKNSIDLDNFMKFDKILLDAPCTGTGTINSKTDFNRYLNETLLNKTTKIQEKLLEKAIKLLKKGGSIIYSTCSILEKENDEIIKKIITRNTNIHLEKIELLQNNDLKIVKGIENKTITILPDKKFEGFYIAKLVK